MGGVAEYTTTALALRLVELAERMVAGEEYLEEEARRILIELGQRVAFQSLPPAGARLQPALLSKMVEALATAANRLALASKYLSERRYKRLSQTALEIAKTAPLIDMFYAAPAAVAAAAPAPALTLPATDVVKECGGLAARVLREIAAGHSVSEWQLLSWAAANGFSANELNEALQCLLRKGLIEVESGLRGNAYRLAVAPR